MNQRFYSLDVFRGATVAFMILVNNQMSKTYAPLDHASWHGLTPTDLVFPFFLFAVGNAMSFVMPRLEQAGTAVFLKKVFKRAALIFLIGLLLNWSPFVRWHHDALVFKKWTWINDEGMVSGIRILGVLGRIAVCYLFASLIVYFFKIRGALITSVILLLVYWALSAWLGSGQDPFSLAGYFGTHYDILILGEAHMYKGEGIPFDPEGLSSSIPAITSVIAGCITGWYIQKKGKNFEMLSNLFVAALVVLFAGYVWDMFFPVNKKIWSSSYVLVSSAFAMLTIGVLMFAIEFKNAKGAWSRFFDVFGKNALFIFVLSGLVPRILGLIRIQDAERSAHYNTPLSWFYEHICKPLAGGNLKASSLIYSFILVIFYWLLGYLLDKKKIYIKV